MIINEIAQNWDLFGYTDNMKQITIKSCEASKKLEIWMIVPVRIIKGVVFKLEGELLNQ